MSTKIDQVQHRKDIFYLQHIFDVRKIDKNFLESVTDKKIAVAVLMIKRFLFKPLFSNDNRTKTKLIVSIMKRSCFDGVYQKAK